MKTKLFKKVCLMAITLATVAGSDAFNKMFDNNLNNIEARESNPNTKKVMGIAGNPTMPGGIGGDVGSWYTGGAHGSGSGSVSSGKLTGGAIIGGAIAIGVVGGIVAGSGIIGSSSGSPISLYYGGSATTSGVGSTSTSTSTSSTTSESNTEANVENINIDLFETNNDNTIDSDFRILGGHTSTFDLFNTKTVFSRDFAFDGEVTFNYLEDSSTLTSSGTLTEVGVRTKIEAKAKEKGVSEDEYLEMLKKFTGVATYEELKDKDKHKGTITIGRAANKYGLITTKANGAIPFYKEVADSCGFLSFYSEDFDDLVKKFSNAIEVANYGLVLWGIFLNYDFLMCTNPYYYIPPYNALETVEKFKETDSIGGMAYTMELSTIRTFGYNNIREDSQYSLLGANLDTVDFEENYFSWGTIPRPGDPDNWFSYFTPCSYRVTR